VRDKSNIHVLNGSATEVHGADDPTGMEMFNNTTLFKGPWLVLFDNSYPTGEEWNLYKINIDPGQNNNIAC